MSTGVVIMAMFRLATVADYWRTANKRRFPTQLLSAKFNGCMLFDDFTLSFDSGIQAIVGGNGLGKSTLIRTIFNFLYFDGTSSGRTLFKLPITDPLSLELELNLGEVNKKIKPKEDEKIDVFLYDPCFIIPILQHFTSTTKDLEEILESYSEVIYTQEQKSLIEYVSGINYKSIKCINIEDEFEGHPLTVTPYFKIVTQDNIEYDSSSMGMGELSIFYFCWIVDRLSKIEESRLLLLEEPESYLPPVTQERLMNVVAFVAKEKKVQSITCSHSEHILRRFDRNNIKVIRRVNGSYEYDLVNHNFESFKSLGLSAKKEGIIFVEDIVGSVVAQEIVSSSNNYVKDSFYYQVSGSDGEILSTLAKLPKDIEHFKLIGFFDGDCKKNLNTKPIEDKNFKFLPTSKAPEIFLLDYLYSLSLHEQAKLLGIEIRTLELARDLVRGLEYHDQLKEMLIFLDLGYSQGVRRIVKSYIEANRSTNALRETLESVDKI